MYANDKTIKSIISDLSIETDHHNHEFDIDDQVQPCSIDLRIDRVFWKPRRRQTIDLRKPHLLEIQPRRFYKKSTLKESESIIIKPGKSIHARIYEKLTIPPNFAGEITGRSSYARLGLMIHASAGFINPGWRGHMPLQLVNIGLNPIRIVPFLPICQLRLVHLKEVPESLYGERELQSKYQDDDGGPSYWWRDKKIEKLKGTFGQAVGLDIQESVLEVIGRTEPEVIDRLDKFISKMRLDDVTNAEELLEKFSKREQRRKRVRSILFHLSRWAFPATSLFVISILIKMGWSYSWWIVLPGFSLFPFIKTFYTEAGEHYGLKEHNNRIEK